MKRLAFLLFTGLLTFQAFSQEKSQEQPKLVVGIVVDQMRYDYLTRFWDRFGEDGFKKLVNEGYNFKNNHFNYVPTYTGPGHASVYTGTSPMNHGIIGNGWYDKFIHESVYCAGDDSVEPVGTEDDAGKMSPHRMKTTTVSDENRLHTQMRGKTIGVSIKDRGSILPAGHTANAAYWFHGDDEGKWITSSYYMEELPQWVKDFNDSDKVEAYLKPWNTLYDIETYKESGSDKNNFEGGFRGKEDATFPYDLAELSKENGGFDIIENSAYGNDITLEFALAAIEAEELGQDVDTDFLTLSFSSTDKIGHNFGVNSKEIQDTYLRLDKNIAQLLEELNEQVGEGNYTIFLSADHGGGDVPAYLDSVNIPAGYFESDEFREELEQFVSEEFDEDELIESVYNNQIFFNYEVMEEAEISSSELQSKMAHYILQLDQIDKVYTRDQLSSGSFVSGAAVAIQNGFNQKRSGDVVYVLDPATIVYSRTGSTHGSGLMYDTHAPLIFYGNGVKKGSTTQRTEIVDIAPTLSALLGISFPSGTTGKPLYMMLDAEETEVSE
ncbi:alkaline phosphatase PafA [Salegentibacter mishustinae]|uniref:Alkaline phosphatase n=1 Tax=Salegentibacter mishustinae TaxID=270918 RepID=A0A0Q9ZER6_9FLAO|nr:alkaline phosphatase PafA [Salegentibacter mishustinae]KRG28610.1 alkaline phosphatase [Salegentibacter mishustinae]PNW22542.1 alkaline phosphatase [Salegentibacter mishustinae]PZX67785.1 type I phosphodiesterase/nucleotide pyrophosphatase [Salegentibacter mishustinae]